MKKKTKKLNHFSYVRKQLWKNRFLYLMLALPLLYFFVFKYGAIGWLGIAFKRFNARAGLWGSPRHFSLHSPIWLRTAVL